VFFTAGFETTATTLSVASYLLAKHPEVQEKLHDLIVDKVEQYVGLLTFKKLENK
jgi:thromboxane-A synthase